MMWYHYVVLGVLGYGFVGILAYAALNDFPEDPRKRRSAKKPAVKPDD